MQLAIKNEKSMDCIITFGPVKEFTFLGIYNSENELILNRLFTSLYIYEHRLNTECIYDKILCKTNNNRKL